MNAMLAGTMGATVEDTICLHTMTYNLTAAMGTFGRDGMDGALKTIKYVHLTITQPHLKTFIILIAADLTYISAATCKNIREYFFFCSFHIHDPLFIELVFTFYAGLLVPS